jgi:hypothetical protein
MNQRAEVVLEGFVNDRMYRLSIPSMASFDEALSFVEQARQELEQMKETAIRQQAQAQAQAQASQ